MIETVPRLLFVPVSGAFGMGEYARSLAIARAARERWPRADIRFVLSRAAPYAADAPFPATLLDSSPTFHTPAVVALIDAFRPHVVVFDNAGRTGQLRAAHRCGCRVVFISARRRQRRKAFRWRWMQLIDEHWIAYPEFIAGRLLYIERIKLAWRRRPVVRYLDVILSRPEARDADAQVAHARDADARDADARDVDARGVDARDVMTSREGAEGASHGAGDGIGAIAGRSDDGAHRRNGYVLVVPGGGTGHPGAKDAAAIFYNAALRLATGSRDMPARPGHTAASPESGPRVVYVGPAPARAAGAGARPAPAVGAHATAADALRAVAADGMAARLVALGPVPQTTLAALMRDARLIVVNGGSTLLQAIACGKPCVAVPIAGDQRERIERCVRAQVAVAASLDAPRIAEEAMELWQDAQRCNALAARAAGLALADGVDIALRALAGLLGPAAG